jgi:two-component system, NarL family, response regulator NreC
MSITILLVDDHEIFRQGLQVLLSNQPDFKVVGQAANGLDAVILAERLHPDIVIVDMMMPGLSGLDVTNQIRQRLPHSRVIVLSMHDDEGYVLDTLQSGASAYVLKESSTKDLLKATHAAMAGKIFLSPPLSERAIQAYIHKMKNDDTTEYKTLTPREGEVFHLYAENLSGAEIAKRLCISVRTVETHRSNLMHKLDLHSQSELAAYARKQGIIA